MIPSEAPASRPAAGNAGPELAPGERRALAVMAWVATATIVWLVRPIGTGILFGVLLAFTFRSTYARLRRRWRPAGSALATVIGSTFTIAATIGGLIWLLVVEGTILGRRALEALGPGGPAEQLRHLENLTSRLGFSTDELLARARALVLGGLSRAESIAAAVASATASVALAFVFQMLTMYFVLTHWRVVVTAAQDTLPLRPDHTLKLLEEFRRVGRATLLGTVVLGLLQAVLACVGYWIAGLPEPLFFGALTAVASLVPGVGTLLVWVPAGVVLILLGHVGAGVFLIVWGVVVVTGIPEYILRPRLIGRDQRIPSLFMLAALFGGAAMLGFKGLIIGPVLMTMAIATLRIYAEETRTRRQAEAVPAILHGGGVSPGGPGGGGSTPGAATTG